METEFNYQIDKNSYSLFKIFCEKCGKLLIVEDPGKKSDDKFITSHNCLHHFCQNCMQDNHCPICNQEVKEFENFEDETNDIDRKDYLEKMFNCYFKIYQKKNDLANVICNKKLMKNCNKTNNILNFCSNCFEENLHKDDCEIDGCEDCKKKLLESLYCETCTTSHMSKTKSHELNLTSQIQEDYEQLCEENLTILDKNIILIDEQINKIDNFINESEKDIKNSKNELYNEYDKIEKNFENESNEFLDEIETIKMKIDIINSNKNTIENLEDEMEKLTQLIDNVEVMHQQKHNFKKVYESKYANDLWVTKYGKVNENVNNINSAIKRNLFETDSIEMIDIVLEDNLKKKLSNWNEIKSEKSEYDCKFFQNLTFPFRSKISPNN